MGRFDPNVEAYSYRLWGADGALVYVGISADVYSRIRQHEKTDWWPHVARLSVRRHNNRNEAALAEHTDWAAHRPVGNIRPPERVARKSYRRKPAPKVVFPAAPKAEVQA